MESPSSRCGPKRRLRGHRLYWICQIGGWSGLWLILLFGAVSLNQRLTLWTVLFQAIWTLALLGATHAYRAAILTFEWQTMDWRRLLPRVAIACLVLSAAVNTPLSSLAFAWFPGDFPEGRRAMLVALSTVQAAIPLGCWSVMYFGYHFYRDYQIGQLERLRLESLVKEAELRALKSQVNPHFLFNALNTLRGLIEEDPARAREAVTQLANLLRAALQAGQHETVELSEELRTVSSYLALEQLRHEERLQVEAQIAPETLGDSVPPLLLQTLVENAVKYGISDRSEGGLITYSARHEGQMLALRVTNPGPLVAPGRSTGVGLRNATERLKLLFGESASLSISSMDNGLVMALVTIPRHRFSAPNP